MPPTIIFHLQKYTGGMILAFLISLFLDRYFGVIGSDLRATYPPSPLICLTVECPPGFYVHVCLCDTLRV